MKFGDVLYDSGNFAIFKTVINVERNNYDENVRYKCRKEYEIEHNIVIGHIGYLTEQKNTLFLIEIFKEIYELDSSAKLLIIGDGNLREAMLEKNGLYKPKDAVLYLGRREDIQHFYNAMDCFVFPSLYEGLPVVGEEAEICGLPMFFQQKFQRNPMQAML